LWDAIIATFEATPALAFAIGAFLSGLVVSLSVVLWGAAHGKYITNLSLALEIQRTPTANNARHDLLTVIKIEKGPVNAFTLQTVKVDVFLIAGDELTAEMEQRHKLPAHHAGGNRPDDVLTPPPETTKKTLNRSLNGAGKRYAELQIFTFLTTDTRHLEHLAPSERTQYAGYATVDSTGIYEVIVTVIGVRYQSYPVRLFWRMVSFGRYRPTRACYTASLITVPADALLQIARHTI
jgi:hypothetical protein